MSVRDLVPWNRGRDVTVRREESNPFLALHREMNRLFDDVFRVTGATPNIPGAKPGQRATQLADAATDVASGLLATLGRPARQSAGALLSIGRRAVATGFTFTFAAIGAAVFPRTKRKTPIPGIM